jgi:tRNA threonylcarbamoyladenosine modification (KEOPS) complex  Pcc1 subunit
MVCDSGKPELLIEQEFSSPESAEAAYTALLPELTTSRRFTVSLSREGSVLRLRVVADDLSALRAALNSYARWVYLLENLDKDV